MKPIYYSYPKPISKSFSKPCFLFLSAIVLTSFFASCTADEIEVQPKNEIIKESSFQRNDTILNDTIPSNTTNTTNGGEIILPPKTPPPPPPSNP
jgi:hypothetical protein